MKKMIIAANGDYDGIKGFNISPEDYKQKRFWTKKNRYKSSEGTSEAHRIEVVDMKEANDFKAQKRSLREFVVVKKGWRAGYVASDHRSMLAWFRESE